jgi:predicted phage terminase large subunit-like protein
MGTAAAVSKRLRDLDRMELTLLKAQRGQLTLREFMAWMAPHEPPPRHLESLIDLLEHAKREPIRVCVSMPPRHGKTITIQRALAWWIWATPADTCAYVSYSDTQAVSKSTTARLLAGRSGVEISGRDTMSEWRTSKGGGLLSAGAGGGITGQGVQGLMVFDDPYKDREEAESAVQREKVWDRFSDVVMTRDEGQSVVICHTRWVEDDLIGRLVREHGWPCLNLTAIAEENDPLGRQPGEALWPDRHSIEKLEAVRSINEYTFASLFQGRPRPRGATVFGPETYYEQDTFSMDGWRLSLYADPAASEKTSADFGAILALAMRGYGEATEACVLDVYRQHRTIPEFVHDLLAWQIRFGNPRIGVESVAGFKAVPQMLHEIDKTLRIKACVPLGDKFTRAQPVATAWHQGRVRVPRPTPARPVPWLKDFLYEISTFTGGSKDSYDDQVDCLSGAWNEGFEQRTISMTKGVLRARRI